MAEARKPTEAPYAVGINQNDLLNQDIIPSALNVAHNTSVVEFNEFEKTVKSYILGMLGAPQVRVELSPYQLKAAIDESISKFAYHAPKWNTQMFVFNTSAGINTYELPKQVIDNISFVAYKQGMLGAQYQNGTLEFDYFLRYFQDNYLFNDFQIGDFNLLQIHMEMMKKILGQHGSWDIIDNKYLQLYPTPVTDAFPVIVEYRALNSDTIHHAYRNWIQKYALAIAKGALAQIRGKYKVLPGPGGGAQLNGEELLAQSKEEKELLEKQLVEEFEEPTSFSMF